MYMKLDKEVERMLCCSLCKSDLTRYSDYFICTSCGLRFPGRYIKLDEENEELVFDFRIHHPDYCMPEGLESWDDAQSKYKQYTVSKMVRDSLQEYLDEIDSIREIYTDEYDIGGKVLDVGGHQGRLRHFLGEDVSLYVSVDPYINIFSGIKLHPNLIRAYPCLSESCNFISAHAEYLPFKTGSFDWVHMRSVVDHFADPYLAFLEAYRCSSVGGKLLVGLSIQEKKYGLDKKTIVSPDHLAPIKAPLPIRVAEKLKRGGPLGLLRSISRSFHQLGTSDRPSHHTDDHMFRFTYETLMDLYMKTGWDIVKEHWQKPPFQFCIYVCGQKRELIPMV